MGFVARHTTVVERRELTRERFRDKVHMYGVCELVTSLPCPVLSCLRTYWTGQGQVRERKWPKWGPQHQAAPSITRHHHASPPHSNKWSPNAALRVPELRKAWSENCAPTAIALADQGLCYCYLACSVFGLVFSSFDASETHGLPGAQRKSRGNQVCISLSPHLSFFPLTPLTPFTPFCSALLPSSAAMTLPSLLTWTVTPSS